MSSPPGKQSPKEAPKQSGPKEQKKVQSKVEPKKPSESKTEPKKPSESKTEQKKASESKTTAKKPSESKVDSKKTPESKTDPKKSPASKTESQKSPESNTSSSVKTKSSSAEKTDTKDSKEKTKSSGSLAMKSNNTEKLGSSDSKKSVSSQESSESKNSKVSKGMEQSLRMTSTDIREITKESQTANMSAGGLIPSGGAPPGESVFDTVAYVILCPVHNKMAIFNADKDKITWLPFIACPHNRTWKLSAEDGISIIFNRQDQELDAKLGTKVPIKEKRCLHIFRTQIPNKQRFISLVIYYVVLDVDKSGKFKCCRNEKRIKWLPISEVKAGKIENVWGPEPQDFTQDNVLGPKRKGTTGFTEQSYEQVKELLPKGEAKTPEQQMIKGAAIGEVELDKLYDDYIEHCFPSLTMSVDSFKSYLSKYMPDLDNNRFPRLFNAFNIKKNNCLNFYELINGLAAMETKETYCEARLFFIFRYYNTDCSGKLTLADYRKMIKDDSVGSSDATIDAKASETFKQLNAGDAIEFAVFKKGVENKVIKGVSRLCKASILEQITKSTTNRIEKKSAVKKKADFLMQNRRNKGKCLACRGKKYDYGLHAIKLDTNGRCVEPRRIFEPDAATDKMTPQKYSMEYTFNTRSIAHTVKDLIRDFSRKKQNKGFLSQDRETLVSYIQALGRDVEDFFAGEDRLIKVNSPAFVFGDLNGNIDQLLQYERTLFQPFPILSGHYIFMGNFIGSGKWGVECALYLLALKLISPLKIILCRGSNETRELQKKCKFESECTDKYGSKEGAKICELLNSIFDKMPLCTIVDENIFCAHSGVPSVTSHSQISAIPRDLKNPEKSQIAWEMMSGTPDEAKLHKLLKSLQLSYMIRGNTAPDSGYQVDFKGKLLTINSGSSGKGRAAVAFIDSDKMRVLHFDPSKDQMKKESKTEPKTETLSK